MRRTLPLFLLISISAEVILNAGLSHADMVAIPPFNPAHPVNLATMVLFFVLTVIIMGKPPALPGDSQSLTFPGVLILLHAPGYSRGREDHLRTFRQSLGIPWAVRLFIAAITQSMKRGHPTYEQATSMGEAAKLILRQPL